MKTLSIIALFLIFSASAQNGFEQGNAFYQNEKYAEAATVYESVLKSGKESADLYFNLGNAYYKQNKVAPAIYNYEKALILKPGDREIHNNLRFAQKLTIDEIKEVPKVGFSKLLRDFSGTYSYDAWAKIAVSFSFIFLLFFVGYYFTGTALLKRIFFVGMFVIVIAMIVSILAAFFEKDHYETDRPAIVFSESAEVKSEPRSAAAAVFVLHEGSKVMVMENVRDWSRIELLDGSDGWIESSRIKEVK